MLVLESSFLSLSIRLLCFQVRVGIWWVYYLDHWSVAHR